MKKFPVLSGFCAAVLLMTSPAFAQDDQGGMQVINFEYEQQQPASATSGNAGSGASSDEEILNDLFGTPPSTAGTGEAENIKIERSPQTQPQEATPKAAPAVKKEPDAASKRTVAQKSSGTKSSAAGKSAASKELTLPEDPDLRRWALAQMAWNKVGSSGPECVDGPSLVPNRLLYPIDKACYPGKAWTAKKTYSKKSKAGTVKKSKAKVVKKRTTRAPVCPPCP